MRKYTSKSQKIDLYSAKYNISKEEVKRMLSEHEDVLTLEELNLEQKEVLKYIDVLIDGPFIQDLRDITLKLRGSSNQRILEKGIDF